MTPPPMRGRDYLAMAACYALVALLAWMTLFPRDFAAMVMGLLP